MLPFRFLTLTLLLSITPAARAQDWQLTWSDEFDTPGLPDPTRWNYDIGGHGWGNQELQYYTDRTENARVEDGTLIIEARREEFGGNAYTSARLVTRDLAAWQYGRIEARIKLPYGQGIWPAFWMLPTDSPYGGWPTGGEIDIMEYLGHDKDRVYGTIHSGGGELGHRFTGTHYDLPTGTFDEEFHTFALEWEPRRMRWYVDGTLYQTQVSWSSAGGPYPAPFDHPFHILLNVAVGGQWPGYPDATTEFPQRMEIDYVRVYQDADAHPDVVLRGPAADTTIAAGAGLSLSAEASDGGEVTEVVFLQGDGILGVATEPPYALEIANAEDGCYGIRARAVDDAGYETVTASVAVTVGAGCPPGATAPYLMTPPTIPGRVEAEYYDLGGEGVAYLDFSAPNEGAGIRQDEGVDTRPSRDEGGGSDVTNILAREWLRYTVDVEQSGSYRVMARVASGSGGMMRMSVDGDDLFGDVAISPTGGDVTYGNALIGVAELTAGRHELRLDMRSAGFSLNRLTFAFVGGTSTDHAAETQPLNLYAAPNPVAGAGSIHYELPRPDHVDVALFDVLGRRVRTIVSGPEAAGGHVARFDAGALAPGVYLCALKTASGPGKTISVIIR